MTPLMMRRARRPGRRLTRPAFALAVLAITALPQRVQAQIPVVDVPSTGSAWGHFIAEWAARYQVLANWRNKLRTKVRTGNHWLDQVDNVRMAVEQNAYGELVGLGQRYIETKDFANNETWQSVGTQAFEAVSKIDGAVARAQGLRRQMLTMAENASYTRRRALFQKGAVFAEHWTKIMGRELAEWAADPKAKAAFKVLNKGFEWQEDHVKKMLDGAIKLDGRVAEIDRMMANFQRDNELEKALSSGRADQLTALITYHEGRIQNEIARVEASVVRNKAVQVLRRNHRERRRGDNPWAI